MTNFTIETIKFAEKNLIDLSIVCTTKESQNILKAYCPTKSGVQKIKVLPFKKDLAKKFQNYDVVAGPSGTTTLKQF